MIWHRINLNHLLLLMGKDAGDIPMEFGFVLLRDEGLSPFDSKHNVNIELGIGSCHDGFPNAIKFGGDVLIFRRFHL